MDFCGQRGEVVEVPHHYVDFTYGRPESDLIELGNRRQLLFQGKRNRKAKADSAHFGRMVVLSQLRPVAIAHADGQQDVNYTAKPKEVSKARKRGHDNQNKARNFAVICKRLLME